VASVSDPPRIGRPPKVDDAGVGTRERLLTAAFDACVEHGFEGATVADIAKRADVSAPAIYNHFGGRVELLVAAGQDALGRLRSATYGRDLDAAAVARAFLSEDFAASRRLLAELHLAAQRHREVAELLAVWHAGEARTWAPGAVGDPGPTVKTFFAILLGLCHVEALAAVPGSLDSVAATVAPLVAALFDPTSDPASHNVHDEETSR